MTKTCATVHASNQHFSGNGSSRFWRRWISIAVWTILALLTTLQFAAFAQTQPAAEQMTTTYVDTPALEDLFAKLGVATDQNDAHDIASEIWAVWLSPTDPDLVSRMQIVTEAHLAGALPAAIRLLDEVIIDYPEYAESWNLRATLHFYLQAYQASLDDVAEVLAREPRHFGALAGKAMILMRMGKESAARLTMLEALKYHPFLAERTMFETLLDRPTHT